MAYYDPKVGHSLQTNRNIENKTERQLFRLVVDEPQNHFGLKKKKTAH